MEYLMGILCIFVDFFGRRLKKNKIVCLVFRWMFLLCFLVVVWYKLGFVKFFVVFLKENGVKYFKWFNLNFIKNVFSFCCKC